MTEFLRPVNEPINILHVIGYMDRGGAETFLMNVLRNIDRDKYRFTFLCFTDRDFDYEPEVNQLGSKIVRIPGIKKGGLIKNIIRMVKIMRREGIDVVHTHLFYDSIFSLVAAYIAGIKVRINHSHNTKFEEAPSLKKRIYFWICHRVEFFFVTKRIACTHDAGVALFGKNLNFEIVNNGIQLSDFYYNQKARLSIRSEFGIDLDDVVIMHVGRFDEQKNHKFIIRTFQQYVIKNTKSKLILIGAGPLEQSIKSMVKELCLEDHVIFLGKRGDVSRFYSAADIFFFPSLFEGLGIVLIEAQANNLQSLVSEGVPVEANLTGLVHYRSLVQNSEMWAKDIDALVIEGHGRVPVKNSLMSSYDIRDVSRRVEAIYSNEVNES